MNKKNKGDFGYLNYKKKLNFIIAAVALLIIIAVFITGLIIFKSRNILLYGAMWRRRSDSPAI